MIQGLEIGAEEVKFADPDKNWGEGDNKVSESFDFSTVESRSIYKKWEDLKKTVSHGIFRDEGNKLITTEDDIDQIGLDYIRKNQYQILLWNRPNIWKDPFNDIGDPNRTDTVIDLIKLAREDGAKLEQALDDNELMCYFGTFVNAMPNNKDFSNDTIELLRFFEEESKQPEDKNVDYDQIKTIKAEDGSHSIFKKGLNKLTFIDSESVKHELRKKNRMNWWAKF